MQPDTSRKSVARFKGELIRFAARAYHGGLCGPFTGLLSMRLPSRDLLLVTPAGLPLGEIGPEKLILMDLEENILERPRGVVLPAEVPYVVNAFRKRRNVSAVGHFYPPYAAACERVGGGIPLITAASRQTLREILRVRCKTCPSRFEGLCACIEGQRNSPAGVNILLIEDDGLVVLGKTLAAVLMLAELTEHAARIAWIVETHRRQPVGSCLDPR